MFLTPTFLGVEPAAYEDGGRRYAPMTGELEAGLALMAALDPERRAAAAVGERPEEVHAGAGRDGVVPLAEGSAVGGWTAAERALLLDLAARWIETLPEPLRRGADPGSCSRSGRDPFRLARPDRRQRSCLLPHTGAAAADRVLDPGRYRGCRRALSLDLPEPGQRVWRGGPAAGVRTRLAGGDGRGGRRMRRRKAGTSTGVPLPPTCRGSTPEPPSEPPDRPPPACRTLPGARRGMGAKRGRMTNSGRRWQTHAARVMNAPQRPSDTPTPPCPPPVDARGSQQEFMKPIPFQGETGLPCCGG